MFERCCNHQSFVKYEIVHAPKPIILSNEMDAVIKKLIWYVPNIDSFQAEKNELIGDKVYDDFSFSYIMKMMGIDEHIDVKWIDTKDVLDDEDSWQYTSMLLITEIGCRMWMGRSFSMNYNNVREK